MHCHGIASKSDTSATKVNFLSLNVCGLRSKLKQVEFLDFMKGYDIIMLTETKTDKVDLDFLTETFASQGYLTHFQSRKSNSNSNQKSGGIALIFKENLSQYISVITKESECVLWFMIDKSLFGTEQDILAGAVYIPPEGTKYSNVTIFDDIDSCLIDLCNDDKCVLLFGDFNAYTRCNEDFISVNDDLTLTNFMNQSEVLDSLPVRHSKDKYRPNNYGYRLLELCKSHSVYIFNGRLGRDAGVGEFTSSESTVIDYVIGSLPLFKHVSDFHVAPFDALLSDVHSPICLAMSSPVERTINPPSDKPASLPTPRCERIRPWTDARASQFRNQLEAVNLDEINRLIDQEGASVKEINEGLANIFN